MATGTCDLCGAVEDADQGVSATIEATRYRDLYVWFCRWDHVAEWAARGTPDLAPAPTSDGTVAAAGCFMMMLVCLAIFAVGLVTVLRAVL